MVPILWGVVLLGTADECDGSLALVGRWVLLERSDGFIEAQRYSTPNQALAAYLDLAPCHAGIEGAF